MLYYYVIIKIKKGNIIFNFNRSLICGVGQNTEKKKKQQMKGNHKTEQGS